MKIIDFGTYTHSFALFAVIFFGTACALRPAAPLSSEYYLIGIAECKETDLISDLQIVRCAARVEEGLRQRYNNARGARTVGGAFRCSLQEFLRWSRVFPVRTA
jgi:hypothetical protein